MDSLALHRTMLTIREAEPARAQPSAGGEVPGLIHLPAGREGVATGACAALGPADGVASAHRGHGRAIARGIALDAFCAEVRG